MGQGWRRRGIAIRPQPNHHLFRRNGTTEKVSLSAVTTIHTKECQLLLRLHTLRHYLHAEFVPARDKAETRRVRRKGWGDLF